MEARHPRYVNNQGEDGHVAYVLVAEDSLANIDRAACQRSFTAGTQAYQRRILALRFVTGTRYICLRYGLGTGQMAPSADRLHGRWCASGCVSGVSDWRRFEDVGTAIEVYRVVACGEYVPLRGVSLRSSESRKLDSVSERNRRVKGWAPFAGQ